MPKPTLYGEPLHLYPLAALSKPRNTHTSLLAQCAPYIVDAMPKPGFHPFYEVACRDACRDLYALLRTSAVFFHPAAEALWSSPPTINVLMLVLLHPLRARDRDDKLKGLQDMEMYLYYKCQGLLGIGDSQRDPALLRFLFYAQAVLRLRASSLDAPTTFLTYLRVNLWSGHTVFPRLQQLSWREVQPCLASGKIVPFLCVSRVTDLTLQFQFAAENAEGRDFYVAGVVETLTAVSNTVPQLRKLSLQASAMIPIPISAILRYDVLEHADLHISIAGQNSDLVPHFDFVKAGVLTALELHWTPLTHLDTILSILCTGSLRELTIMAYGNPGNSFASDLLLVTACTPPQLTRFEVYVLGNNTSSVNVGPFSEHFKSLLSRPALQHVTLVLTGYSFGMTSVDLASMAWAWPDLRTLNLSFPLVEGCVIPDLRHVLTIICPRCPQLRLLHLPALSTSSRHSYFALPTFPNSSLDSLSLDSVYFEHCILDISFALYEAFPCLAQTGTHDQPSVWGDVHALVEALRGRNHPVILEHVASRMRAGIYEDLPSSFFLIAYSALQLAIRKMERMTPLLLPLPSL
ncbi:hypothetical protein C8Q77DRAFT_1074879 [Trametes polyzona]|nr:hypothetical protein C8Q77DRAFT_1074879 [Trametes polyzona]